MFPVPTVAQLAEFSGRPEVSYTTFADSALLQATIEFTTVTELSADDYPSLKPDDQVLATQGVLARADWVYLRQPYAQMIATPAMSETIGSYTYSKPPPLQVRNVQAQELSSTNTGIPLWDIAVQFLSKRTRANGVFFGQLQVFEHTAPDDLVKLMRRDEDGALVLLGPADVNREPFPFGADINAAGFPMDPGI